MSVCVMCVVREADPENGGLCDVCAPPLRVRRHAHVPSWLYALWALAVRREVDAMTSVIVTRKGMSVAEGTVHAFLVVLTCGLWYPVYRMRKHQADRTSKTVIS